MIDATEQQTAPQEAVQPAKRGRGRPRRDWSARSVLLMPLAAAFMENLVRKSQRDIDIIKRRLGMRGPRETLESLGTEYGLTREAMRQVVKRFSREVFGGQAGIDLFISACMQATIDGPVPLTALDGSHPLFEGLGENLQILEATFPLIEALSAEMQGNLPHIREISGVASLVPVPAKVWDEAVDDTTRILRLALPDASATRTEAMLAHLPAGTQQAVVEAARMEDAGTEHGDIRTCVRLLLEDSPEPVSLKDIAIRVAEVTGSPVKLQRVVNVANRVGVRVARGRYTIPERVKMDADETDAIRSATEAVLRAGPNGRQWHAQEIVARIAGAQGIRMDLTPEMLDFAIKGHGGVLSLGRMVYALDTDDSEAQRTHLRDLVLAAIEEAGRPLSRREIKQAITKVRGLGSGFHVHEGNGIVRLPDATYATEAMAARIAVQVKEPAEQWAA